LLYVVLCRGWRVPDLVYYCRCIEILCLINSVKVKWKLSNEPAALRVTLKFLSNDSFAMCITSYICCMYETIKLSFVCVYPSILWECLLMSQLLLLITVPSNQKCLLTCIKCTIIRPGDEFNLLIHMSRYWMYLPWFKKIHWSFSFLR